MSPDRRWSSTAARSAADSRFHPRPPARTPHGVWAGGFLRAVRLPPMPLMLRGAAWAHEALGPCALHEAFGMRRAAPSGLPAPWPALGARIACPGARGQGIAGRPLAQGPPDGHTAGYKPRARLRRLRAHRHGRRPRRGGVKPGGDRPISAECRTLGVPSRVSRATQNPGTRPVSGVRAGIRIQALDPVEAAAGSRPG